MTKSVPNFEQTACQFCRAECHLKKSPYPLKAKAPPSGAVGAVAFLFSLVRCNPLYCYTHLIYKGLFFKVKEYILYFPILLFVGGRQRSSTGVNSCQRASYSHSLFAALIRPLMLACAEFSAIVSAVSLYSLSSVAQR